MKRQIPVKRKGKITGCSIKGCAEDYYASKLCRTHYAKLLYRRHKHLPLNIEKNLPKSKGKALYCRLCKGPRFFGHPWALCRECRNEWQREHRMKHHARYRALEKKSYQKHIKARRAAQARRDKLRRSNHEAVKK